MAFRFRRTLLAALLAAALPASLLLPARSAAAKEKWVEVRTPHFTVVSDASERKARNVAREFERIRTVFRASLPDPDATEPVLPITIYAIRDERGLKKLAPHLFTRTSVHTAGLVATLPGRIHVAVRLDLGEQGRRTMYHEYHHLYMNRAAPWAPLWLKEGLAELWGGALIRDKTVEVGRPDRVDFQGAAGSTQIAIRELFTVDHASSRYRHGDHAPAFYAQSEALVHMLVLGEPDGEKKLRTFVDLLDRGVPQDVALRETYGEPEEVDKRRYAYVRNHKIGFVRSTLKEDIAEADLVVRRLSAADTRVRLAEFMAFGPDPEAARPLLDAALAEAPDDAAATALLGVLALRKDDVRAAADLFAKAAARTDADFHAQYLAGVTAALRTTPAGSEVAEKHLARAVERNPRYAPALVRLARARLCETCDPAEAVRLAMRAVELEPGDPAYLLRAAEVLRAAGRKSESAQLATQASLRALRYGAAASNEICWNGALSGFAEVVFAACENAVTREPESWSIRDTRGLARALTGDPKGAIEDFRFAVEKADGPKKDAFVARRKAWIEALEAGRNPFDAATLRELDEESGYLGE